MQTVKIAARRIDSITGEDDPHGIPQMDCPARGGEINPQFSCRDCPCALSLDTHEVVDDRGDRFQMVIAEECSCQFCRAVVGSGEGGLIAVVCAAPTARDAELRVEVQQ